MRTAALLLLFSGCALDAGHGFVTLSEASLNAAIEPSVARKLPGGSILTDLGYSVLVNTATIGVEHVEIETLFGGESGGTFDPADPPPGYSLCHGGHCHHESGRLVPYAEIQASGGGAAFQPALTLEIEREVDLLAGAPLVVEEILPGLELDQSTWARVRIDVTTLHLVLRVRGGDLGDREETLQITALLDGSATGGVEQTIDRSAPARARLNVAWIFDASLFDGINFVDGAPEAELIAERVVAVRPALELRDEVEE